MSTTDVGLEPTDRDPVVNPIVAVRGITKIYGATRALDGVDVDFREGAVTAVVGANGSGKTTLLKVVSGLIDSSEGTVTGPEGHEIRNLQAAQGAGVVLVPQEPTLAGHLPVWQNVCLGRPEARRGPFLDNRAGRALAREHLAGMLPGDVLDRTTSTLSKSSRQLVQLAAATAKKPRVLMLDEPTAVLDEDGVTALDGLIRRFVADGGSVIIVSHRLRDILELADDVVVLRNGKVGLAAPVSAATERSIVQLLTADERPDCARHTPDASHVVLEAQDIVGWRGLRVDRLEVRAGEVLGIAGQSGSGRSRLAAVLAGAHPAAGTARVEGRSYRFGNIRAARAAGVAYIPEDRQETAILGNLPVSANLVVGREDAAVRRGPLRRRAGERAITRELIDRFEVRPADPDRPAALLSGGNQQKLVVGRALSQSGTKVVIADEPTQGVDASARGAIHASLAAAAAGGCAVVAVCSEFEELFEIADRVVVMRDGALVLDRPLHETNADEVLAASLGSDTTSIDERDEAR
ncbi:sugar ABC transporter ATP-binding protein [Nocardioides sp. WS12]|uniref:sugar ABC transporter ATP-binding protein n=1 Tax=Nocardioides sp. WS12 TaxID=2486272 RepID=UPI0015FC754E|nr:sugar ABC transporter ATP-binding protein [Nocardioides sp. WS12]